MIQINKFKKFVLSLQFIFMPKYWMMIEKYSSQWDKELNNLLDNYVFHRSMDGGFTAIIGNRRIWIQNHPDSSFMPYIGSGLKAHTAKYRASRLTILRAYTQYIKDTNPYDKH